MKNKLIVGDVVSLRPLTLNDKETFYKWATQSDGTKFWYGEEFNDPIPSGEKFFEDFTDIYFDGSEPDKGRSFAIIFNENNEEIGQINYQIDKEIKEELVYDFDIIIVSKIYFGKGIGTMALKMLTKYVKQNFNPEYLTIYVAPQNQRALKSYLKVGFIIDREIVENNVKWLKLVMK